MFRGSIAVIVIYLVVAVALLLAMLFQPGGVGAFLADDAVVFTVTLVVGMVLIGVYMVRYVLAYDPKMVFVPVKPVSCPDFYNLTMSDSPDVPFEKRATCVATDVYSSKVVVTSGGSDAAVVEKLRPSLGDSSNCSTLYPIALVNSETDPYDMRQAFSTKCDVPWTDNLGNFALLDYNKMVI